MNNLLNITEEKICTGCGACQNKCPNNAISMKEDEEGFLFPNIDKTKCTNCGLCEKTCPILNPKFNKKSNTCYVTMANDDIRMKSASGGAFSVIANYVLENNGYVAGAAYDEDWNVHHIIIDNKEDLDKLRRSKYVQSKTEDIYIQVKNLLEKGKMVLFSGTPCQVAGLYGFLGIGGGEFSSE